MPSLFNWSILQYWLIQYPRSIKDFRNFYQKKFFLFGKFHKKILLELYRNKLSDIHKE
jgi:hypothetical protein